MFDSGGFWRVNFETWFQSNHQNIPIQSATAVLELVKEGATIPFIARYRKEKTGNLDEVGIQEVIESHERFDLLIKRQAFILGEIDRQKKLTDELKAQILGTFQPEVLEDIYLPFKLKRKTKAAAAKEAGLEPLADWIWNCGHQTESPLPGQTLELWAFTFRDEAKGIADAAAAISGAEDILIERISEIQELRQTVRDAIFKKGVIRTKKAKKAKENSKFSNYFDYHEAVSSLLLPQNSHRYLAVKRGWSEDELNLSVEGPPTEETFESDLILAFEEAACTDRSSPGAEILLKAARLAYKAHVLSSIENEVHKALKEVADAAAIQVFSENLRRLLLAAPYGAKSVLGIDPGLKTGCKVAVIDESGKYIASAVLHLLTDAEKAKAQVIIPEIVKTGNISAIAVGNGTAGRETEAFIRKVLKDADIPIPVVMVSEAGASVYSASEVAREEFPDLDVTVRGAISIARRLQDPLAELVKTEPKSIGVGQYQHDVSPHSLKRSLQLVMESCVNQVGVNLNTASLHLLSCVSGLGPSLAKAIVDYRHEKGLFQSRSDLLNVNRFTKKAFELAAGFLRIPSGAYALDNTAVHPENYPHIEKLAERLGKPVKELTGSGVKFIREDAQFKEDVGKFTFEDIVSELSRPGRDPREEFVYFQFRDDIHELKDLKSGMVCPGIVTNVTNFGAFVDIGVHQDGLVHISQLSDKFIKDPKEAVAPGDRVKVRVIEANLEKNQISLSMKNVIEPSKPTIKPKPIPNPQLSVKAPPRPVRSGREVPRKREAFNNPFGGLADLRSSLKSKK